MDHDHVKRGSCQSRVVTSLQEDAQAILIQFLEFVVDLLKAFLHENSFYLVFIAAEIHLNLQCLPNHWSWRRAFIQKTRK